MSRRVGSSGQGQLSGAINGRSFRRWLQRRRGVPSLFRELAYQPVWLQRIVEPRFRPTTRETASDKGSIDLLTIKIEQRQLATGLGKAAAQVQKFI